MAYDIKNTKVIYLGRQGENLARTIEIDVSSMLMKWPDATISLLVQRNQEDTFYLAPVVIENGILKWTITNADTEIAGIGKIEVRAIQDNAIMKSATMKICVENSLGGTETVVPDPVQTWVDTIVAASVQAKQSAEDALASELAAKEAAESITGLESNIKTAEAARVEAEKVRISAENERESAETSRETAENNRVAAETARVTAEQSRASAETARESAETDRQTTFETNEAQRQTAFETAEAGRAAAESSRVAAEESRVSAEAGRVEAESERVNAENQRAETFAGYEMRIDTATPDDSTVDGKPWTSRKIVDTLCPPFDVSGSAVTCHPVERYPLNVVSRIDATQSGTGDASPENVRPISGWNAVIMNRCGKNLVHSKHAPGYTETKNGLTFTVNGDYSVHVSGTATVETYFDFKTIKHKTINTIINAMDKTVKKNGYTAKDLSVQTYPNGSTALYLVITKGQTVDRTYYPIFVYGDETAYEPYNINSATYTAELPETVYGGELDWNTGVLTVDRAIDVKTSGDIREDATGTEFVTPAKYKCSIPYYTLCNCINGFTHTGNFYRVSKSKAGYETLTELKEALGDTPIQLCYKLATPYTIQLTPQQITALSGVNTLYTDSGDISVSGRTDMIWLTQSLIDRIAALETAAVSE